MRERGILTGKTEKHGGSGWGEERGSGGFEATRKCLLISVVLRVCYC